MLEWQLTDLRCVVGDGVAPFLIAPLRVADHQFVVVRAADSQVRLFLRWYPSKDKYYSWYLHAIIIGWLIPPLRLLCAAINIAQWL
jgi:hypothetical protein